MATINREKAIEEVSKALQDTTIWLEDNQYLEFSEDEDEASDWNYHCGKEDAYQNVLNMLTHNVTLKEG